MKNHKVCVTFALALVIAMLSQACVLADFGVAVSQVDAYVKGDDGNLRFVTEVTKDDGDDIDDVLGFGTWFVTADYLLQLTGAQEPEGFFGEGDGGHVLRIASENSTGKNSTDFKTPDADGKYHFTTDILNIPSAYSDKEIYAKSFVRLEGGTVVTSPLASTNVDKTVGEGGDKEYTPTVYGSYKVTISQKSASATLSVNGTNVASGSNVPFNSVVKINVSYQSTSGASLTVKQGDNNVTRYSDEACTTETTSVTAGNYYFRMPAGDVTVSVSSCIAEGTLITLADGTQKAVEELTGDELLLAWDLETGEYTTAPIVFIDSDPENEFEIIHLYFSDGTDVEVISEHGFFDVDEGKYVYLDANADKYIGDSFVKQSDIGGNVWDTVTLDRVDIEYKTTRAYSPVTFGHLCYYVNGMLSMPGGIWGLFNIFDVDTQTMKYDAEQKEQDLLTYGEFSYSDFEDVVSETFFEAFNGRFLKTAIGKGLLTWDDIEYMADRYNPMAE